MLDTNICIYTIKHKPPEVIKNFLRHNPDEMCISSITYAELMHGVEKSQSVERNRMAITLFLSAITILPFNQYAAEEYGKGSIVCIPEAEYPTQQAAFEEKLEDELELLTAEAKIRGMDKGQFIQFCQHIFEKMEMVPE